MKNICKGCDTTVHMEEDEISKILNSLVIQGKNVVSDEMYENRLSVCLGCENLQYDTTCKVCGCIVKIRAKMADKKCPHPNGSLWE